MSITSSRIHVIRALCLAGTMLLVCLLGETVVRAQVYTSLEDTTVYFTARVLDSVTRLPVPFAHIINTTKRSATISDTLGYFYIQTSPGDQLQFTAIGFGQGQLRIGYTLLRSAIIHDILLKPFIYSIDAVRVNPLGSYDQFRQRFVTMKSPESAYEINPTVLFDIDRGMDTLDMLIIPPMSPVTALYNLLSKEGKSKRKLQKLIEEETFAKQVEFKYSPGIVSHITGYTGFDLYEFMDFCSFSKEFLLDATYYEIARAILVKKQKFEIYPKD